jgi:hypothetical protein
LAATATCEASATSSIDTHDLVTSGLFGSAAILNCLVLFNLLFAVQSVLDVVYLWGGASLPDGVTYAAYAHRGAYPLIATALLAAGFILAATYTGSARNSRLIRGLILVWTAQNVMLVISSILRLDLYVEVYSLTYWRVAAFIWMLLVAVGLVLIVARMMLDRSNRWLILANTSALAFTLYACAFINFPAIIANYNVAHCLEISGEGVELDRSYLKDLGPQAVPALDRYNRHMKMWHFEPGYRDNVVATLDVELGSWRSWGFRKWRLQRYLKHHAAS